MLEKFARRARFFTGSADTQNAEFGVDCDTGCEVAAHEFDVSALRMLFKVLIVFAPVFSYIASDHRKWAGPNNVIRCRRAAACGCDEVWVRCDMRGRKCGAG